MLACNKGEINRGTNCVSIAYDVIKRNSKYAQLNLLEAFGSVSSSYSTSILSVFEIKLKIHRHRNGAVRFFSLMKVR